VEGSKPASLMRSRARRRVGRARERNNRINCRDYFDARTKCRLMLHLQHAHRHALLMYYAITPRGGGRGVYGRISKLAVALIVKYDTVISG